MKATICTAFKKRWNMKILLFFMAAVMLFTGISGCTGKSEQALPNSNLLASPSDIEKNMGKWIVLDCRSKAAYGEGHIPGAISLGDRCETLIRNSQKIIEKIGSDSPGAIKAALADGKIDKDTIIAGFRLIPVEDMERLFAHAGISLEKTVVIYSNRMDTMTGAYLVPFFALEYLGHQDVRILDGGFEAWTAEGKTLEQKENKLLPSDLKAKAVKGKLITTEEVLKVAKGEVKDVQLVDSRLISEYLGDTVAPPGAPLEKAIERGGRIPKTTINVPHILQYKDTETLRVKPAERLERMYLTLDKNKKTIVYCATGTRASLNYFVLRLLGFKDVGIYYDSWLAWGNDKSLPVEKGPR